MRQPNTRIYRRHRPKCKFFGVGNSWDMLNCNCPLYGDGYVDGKRVLRKSLDTRNLAVASKRLGERMAKHTDPDASEPESERKSISAAAEAFLNHHGTIQEGHYHPRQVQFATYRKYRNSLQKFGAFCKDRKIQDIGDVGLEQLDAFRASRTIKPRRIVMSFNCSGSFGRSA